ncbi:glycosyltransferase [Lacticaseibacillus chiayiensis]|uniref:glycosyltransferase n=1 Tax=Lacticaseibacillus chiayiensis TaxID=2100821 RepID=UPI00130485D7|nr:glycosyltransferase [Lacticaseibacillus chiayiensis]QVI33930.1 glycosyltransferase [Lacticaseibacillus chiayiensis]
MTVAILMAVYNGEPFLEEQIDSIISQTYTDWVLYVRDDGSTDLSPAILKYLANRDPRILIVDSNNCLSNGQLANFRELMLATAGQYDYYMFADQDDVWYPDKIRKSLNAALNNVRSSKTPVLVYTNYDINLENKRNRIPAYEQKNKVMSSNDVLVQNWLMGCTMLFNKALSVLAADIPAVSENHDNWVAKVAVLSGKVVYLDEVTMWHRLHSSNVTRQLRRSYFMGEILQIRKTIKTAKASMKNMTDTLILLQQSVKVTNQDTEKRLSTLLYVYQCNRIKRFCLFILNGFHAFDLKQTILFGIILILG